MLAAFAPFARRAAAATTVLAALLLASCGGGGDGDADAAVSAFPASATLAGQCTQDVPKQFVRSFMDETYLWYDEIPEVEASDYDTVSAYFNALVVRTPDASGLPRDRFSSVLTSAGADSQPIPAPRAALGQGVPRDLLAATSPSVPLAGVVNSPAGTRVGYILFNDHNEGSQDALIEAFRKVRDEGVRELVLDMRYNSGGFLYVAQTAASMIVGPQSEGRLFEQLRYNDKRQAETSASVFPFSSRVQTAESTTYPRGYPLPQMALPRVYVLTSGQTCSASESIINALRGIDVEVILVGSTTCGKPYGFHRKDNCGLAFFAIEFQGYNEKNFGDYANGFQPTCPVADNFTAALGSTCDPLLATALGHVDTGTCPAPAASRGPMARGTLLPPREHAPATPTLPLDGRLLRRDR